MTNKVTIQFSYPENKMYHLRISSKFHYPSGSKYGLQSLLNSTPSDLIWSEGKSKEMCNFLITPDSTDWSQVCPAKRHRYKQAMVKPWNILLSWLPSANRESRGRMDGRTHTCTHIRCGRITSCEWSTATWPMSIQRKYTRWQHLPVEKVKVHTGTHSQPCHCINPLLHGRVHNPGLQPPQISWNSDNLSELLRPISESHA